MLDSDAVNNAMGRIKAAEAIWGKCKTKMRAADAAYNLEYNMRRPRGVPLHVPSTAASIIDHARDQVLVSHIITDVDPPGIGAKAEERARKLHKAADKFTEFLSENAEVSLPRQYLHDAVLRGAMCTKMILSDEYRNKPKMRASETESDYQDRVAEWKEYRKAQFPVIVQPIDPINAIVPTTARYPLPWAAEKQQRYAMDFWGDYPDWKQYAAKNEKGEPDAYRFVNVYIYIDDKNYMVFGDGFPAEIRPNPYGFVPYLYSFSGMGRRDWRFDPYYTAVGLLDKVLSELQAEVRLMTAMDALWQYTAWPRLLTTENAQQLRNRLDVGPAGITYVSNLEKSLKWLESPAPPTQLFNILQRLDEKIQDNTISQALSGNRPKGVEYGYLQAILVGQGRLRLGPVLDSTQLFLRWLYNMMLRFQDEVVHDDLIISGQGMGKSTLILKPADINGYYNVKVTMENADPNENDRRLLVGQQLRTSGNISLRSFLREYRKVDPDEEIEEMMVEKIVNMVMEQPQVLQQVLALTAAGKQAQGAAGLREQVKGALEQALPPAGMPQLAPQQPVVPGRPNAPQPTANNELMRLGNLGGAESPVNSRPMGPISGQGAPPS